MSLTEIGLRLCVNHKKCAIIITILIFIVIIMYREKCEHCQANMLLTDSQVALPPFTVSDVSSKHDVILSAYMNSGSRFTGRLLGYRPDAFYFYEPLWKFSIWDYWQPPDVQCGTVTGQCRKLSTSELNTFQPDRIRPEVKEPLISNISKAFKPVELLVNVISRVFSCDLVPLREVIQDRVQDHPNYSGQSWEKYRSCIRSFNAKSKCLKELELTCRNKTHRVMKTIRLTLGALRPLLKTNPRLKVVHLLRDPRAIIHSRRYSRFFPTGDEKREERSMEKSLCSKMMQDVQDFTELMKEFPDRVAVIYYEDLLENLHVRLKQLYRFLGIHYNETFINELAEVRTNLSPPQRGTDFQSDRQRNNTKWWRKFMDWNDVRDVDAECSHVYRKLGYRSFYTEASLRDLTIPGLNIPDMFKETVIK